MKKKRFWESRKVLWITAVIIALLIGVLIFVIFSTAERCENYECFQKNMKRCTEAIYVNSEPEADWRYEIDGFGFDGCKVDVRLLQVKAGELEIERLAGFEMSCYYPLGQGAYPERDLNRCHGRLKEELQGEIIRKLHTHILENLGKIDEGLNTPV